MKKFYRVGYVLFSVWLLMLFISATPPQLSWPNGKDYDLGKIKADKIATAIFEFKNDGDAPLLILKAEVQCHCTGAEFSKEPVSPGEKGYIRVTLNPEHISGIFYKTIRVSTNINKERIKLAIKGEVVK